jgi:hypothetical protein
MENWGGFDFSELREYTTSTPSNSPAAIMSGEAKTIKKYEIPNGRPCRNQNLSAPA